MAVYVYSDVVFLLCTSLVENGICDSGAMALAGYVSATNTLKQFR